MKIGTNIEVIKYWPRAPCMEVIEGVRMTVRCATQLTSQLAATQHMRVDQLPMQPSISEKAGRSPVELI